MYLIKRIFDIIFSISITVLILVWLVPLIMIITFFTTGENPFYFQNRVGKNGKQFKIYKFRSMKGEVPENDPLLSNEEVLRITPFGKFLRKYRIDEFPQFINVLKGDMSVVGPRPERQFFLDQVITHIPHYKKLQEIKPGITSLGQIRFGYADNIQDMLERARYDLKYLENYNLWIDIKIIFATISVVFKGKGK